MKGSFQIHYTVANGKYCMRKENGKNEDLFMTCTVKGYPYLELETQCVSNEYNERSLHIATAWRDDGGENRIKNTTQEESKNL